MKYLATLLVLLTVACTPATPIMTVPEEEIPATTVVYTIVGGKVAYTR